MDELRGKGEAQMTNQEAIDAIRMAISQVEWDYPMDYAAAFDKAIEALQAQEWISVKKDLPGIPCMVLVTGKNGAGGSFGVVKGMYTHKKGWYRDDIGQFADGRGDVITHWMPLPEQPKEELDEAD